MRFAVVASVALVALGLTACGGDDEPSTPATQTTVEEPATTEMAAASEPAKPRRTGRVVKVVDSQFGRVLADAKGEAFYLFEAEKTPRAECYGECARAWPPVLTRGTPRAGPGADRSKLGTTRRRDGTRQVTYAGNPLYYYIQDAPGTILCQNVDEFGGLWLVVKPSGEPVV